MERSFRETLREKLNSQTGTKPESEPFFSPEMSFFEPVTPLWEIKVTRFRSQAQKIPYKNTVEKVAKTIKKEDKVAETTPLKGPSLLVSQLTDNQQKALARLVDWGAILPTQAKDEIYLSQLKKEFRKLARKYHPDLKGPQASALAFHEMRQCYLTCKTAFDTQVSQKAAA